MTNLILQGNKYELTLSGDHTIGTGKRTVGMNDDEITSYNYKTWHGTGKVVEIKTKKELKFYFTTQTRKSHTAGVAFKNDNYNKWDVSLEDFIFSTLFSTAESSKQIAVSNKKAWIDLLSQTIWDEGKTFTTPALEFAFKPILVDTLIEKGIVAELKTMQIQMPLVTY